MEAALRDLRLALRALNRRKGVTALAILWLGLAIGSCIAGFSLVDAFAWRDLPVREPRQLTRVYARDREQRVGSLSWIQYQAFASRPRFGTGLAAECRVGPKVRLMDRDDYPITAGVSENYLDLLEAKPALGESFHADAARDGTVVRSDHYWKTALGALGYKDHLGQSVADFEVVGRLRSRATIYLARQEEQAALRRLETGGMEPAPGRTAVVVPFMELRSVTIGLLMAPFLLVLLVAATNLANLRPIDNEGRRRETAIRLALGAGRRHLLRQHCSETFLLCFVGTAVGILVASWLISPAPALLYAGENYMDFGVRLDGRTFAFSTAALLR